MGMQTAMVVRQLIENSFIAAKSASQLFTCNCNILLLLWPVGFIGQFGIGMDKLTITAFTAEGFRYHENTLENIMPH